MSAATVPVKYTPKANWGKISKQREILSPATKLLCSAEGKQVDKAVRGGEATLSALKLETCLQTWQAWHCCYHILIFIRQFLRELWVFSLKRWHIWISFTCHPLLCPLQIHSSSLPEICRVDERWEEMFNLEAARTGFSLLWVIFHWQWNHIYAESQLSIPCT